MTTALRNLLALASICTFTTLICGGCQDPDGVDPNPVDDDDPIADDDDVLPVECTVEADGAINGTTVIAQKAGEDHVFATCVLEDGICSLLAPAGLDLVLYAEGELVVGCGIEVNLEPSATPHEITIPMGYGGPSHGYTFYAADGTNLGDIQVETTCANGRVVMNTDLAGAYEVIGDQLVDTFGVGSHGSVLADLSRYDFSSGWYLVRRP